MKWVVVLVCLGIAPAAQGASLKELLERAETASVDRRITLEQRNRAAWELHTAWSGLLPGVLGQAAWTRNQYEVVVPFGGGDPLVITPTDQLDATVRVEVPLIDAPRWFRVAATSSADTAAELRDESVRDAVRRQVAVTFYGYAAALAVRESAKRSLAVAEAQQAEQQIRFEAGSVTELELLRAKAEVQRNRQVLADTEQLVANNRRALRTLTGVEVDEDASLPEDDFDTVGELAQLEGHVDELPSVKAAAQDAVTAGRLATAARMSVLPVVSAHFTERFTNATGFLGRDSSFITGVGVAWPINLGLFFNMGVQGSQAAVAELAHERQRLEARDQIHRDYQRLKAAIEKVRAAEAQVESTRRATEAARERYAAGVVTQIDVIQAERDLFGAEVNHVQARTELASSQVSLRISAGLPLAL